MQTYSSPELIVVGPAELVVLGPASGVGDNIDSFTKLPMGIVAGLDD